MIKSSNSHKVSKAKEWSKSSHCTRATQRFTQCSS